MPRVAEVNAFYGFRFSQPESISFMASMGNMKSAKILKVLKAKFGERWADMEAWQSDNHVYEKVRDFFEDEEVWSVQCEMYSNVMTYRRIPCAPKSDASKDEVVVGFDFHVTIIDHDTGKYESIPLCRLQHVMIDMELLMEEAGRRGVSVGEKEPEICFIPVVLECDDDDDDELNQ